MYDCSKIDNLECETMLISELDRGLFRPCLNGVVQKMYGKS